MPSYSCADPKRVAAFVQWVTEEVPEPVDHRQYVWTIPRVLRPAFRKDRKLLGTLGRCAWLVTSPIPEPGEQNGSKNGGSEATATVCKYSVNPSLRRPHQI